MARYCFAGLLLVLVASSSGLGQEGKKPAKPTLKEGIKEIAGSAEFLRNIPKKYATLKSVDLEKRQVRLLLEGDKEEMTWPISPDAELKIKGWWGRLGDFQAESRVWAWFKINRKKEPTAIFMLADDLSEQDIHGDGMPIKSIGKEDLVLKAAGGKERAAPLADCVFTKNKADAALTDFKVNDRVYLNRQSAEKGMPWQVLDTASFAVLRDKQKEVLRERWLKDGLPGTIGFVHLYSGETDLILDHEALRWGRSLRPGDKVEIAQTPPIKALVKQVTTQREKTQVRLVVHSLDLVDLEPGQRAYLRMKAPAAEAQASIYPTDIDLPRSKEERVDWFLANMYCTCGVGGDVCTGHFYTLASCNPNACAHPGTTRKHIAAYIAEGLTDRQIYDRLMKDQGPAMLRPHLLP